MHSLEQLFTVKGLLNDKNNDKLSEGLKGFIYVPEQISYELAALVIELASRIGYESVALDYPLVKVYSGDYPAEAKQGSIVLKRDSNLAAETAELILNNSIVLITANDELAWQGLRNWLGLFPYLTACYTLPDLIDELSSQLGHPVAIDKLKINTQTFTLEVSASCSFRGELGSVNSPSIIERLCINGQDIAFESYDLVEINCPQAVRQSARQNSPNLGNLFNQHYWEQNKPALAATITPVVGLNAYPAIFETVALAHIAARFSLESTELVLPLVCPQTELDGQFSLQVRVVETDNPYLTLRDDQLILTGTASNLELAAKEIYLNYPSLNGNHIIQDLTDLLTATFKGETSDGQFLRIKQLAKSKDLRSAYIAVGPLFEGLPLYKQLLKEDDVELYAAREPREVMTWEYAPQWEVSRAVDLLSQKLYPRIQQGDDIEVRLLVSEQKSIRDQLRTEIESKIDSLGGKVGQVTVLRAYKQGMCWLLEEVVPELRQCGLAQQVSKVRIGFKPLFEKESGWGDEAGATPTLNPAREDNPDKIFDLPIRLLQELYPIDDLLALELPIERNAVEFYDLQNSSNDYLVEFFNTEGQLLYADTFNVKFHQRPYLDAWPHIGKVHPNTGWVQAKINGELVIDERLATDLENIWDYYQQHVLHDVRQYIEVVCNNQITSDKQPFFRELRLEITASDIDYKLPVRQDLVSTLDALHEDLYFVGLDFFRTLGLRGTGDILSEPGLILPIINNKPGCGPRLTATLDVEQQQQACIIGDNYIKTLQPIRHLELFLEKIEFTAAGLDLQYRLEGNVAEIEPLLETALSLAQSGVELIDTELADQLCCIRINYRNDDFMNKQWAASFADQKQPKTQTYAIENLQTPNQVIGVEENEKIIADLKRVPELNVFSLDYSYQGRKIYGIEIKPDFKADIISHKKLLNSKPCFMINGRHHANEVSATNAAYSTIKYLLTTEQGKAYRKGLNIAIIPFENVDGGAVHYQLMQDNPEWKLHVARYNSVGKEIANDYFKTDTPYGECRALPKFYCRWLPDAFVDNHGVPSHEWDQQFAGYVAPWFRGFWLPRALFYGYFWEADDLQYKSHRLITEKVADSVAKNLNTDPEITEWNADWRDRFLKYAHQWMPALFPAEYRQNLIYYWASFSTGSNARHFAPRFPEYTVLDWTTEVSDETAQGDYLGLCSRALTISNLATMQVLTEIPVEFDTRLTRSQGQIYRSRQRVRPIGYR